MPELPEVETVRRYLDSKLPGDRITAVTVDLPRLIKNRTEDAFRRALTDRVFRGPEGEVSDSEAGWPGEPHGASPDDGASRVSGG